MLALDLLLPAHRIIRLMRSRCTGLPPRQELLENAVGGGEFGAKPPQAQLTVFRKGLAALVAREAENTEQAGGFHQAAGQQG